MIRVVAVLSNLHNAEETIALETKLAVDLCIDLERQGTARFLKFSEFVVEGLVLLTRCRIVDPCVQDSPALACG